MQVESIATDATGNSYIAWWTGGPNFANNVTKYDAAGEFLWSQNISTVLPGINVALDPAGNFFVGGRYFNGQNADVYVAKYSEAVPEPSAWALNADGNWSAPANWTAAVPNAAGARAAFTSVITQPRTVTVDVPVTVARIDFDNANAYTIAGPNSLTFDSIGGDAQINVTAGSHTIAAPVMLADNTVITVTLAASNLAIAAPLGASGFTLTKAGAGTLTLTGIRAAGLSINAGTVTMSPHTALAQPSTSVLGALSIAGDATPAAKLDLTNNAAVIDHAAPSPAATVRQQIVAGRGGAGLGKTWNGNGITSSAAATANAADAESRSLGYAENSQLPLGPYTDFRGQPVDGTSLLIAYTRTGDANLDGVVNDDDVTIVGAKYAPVS